MVVAQAPEATVTMSAGWVERPRLAWALRIVVHVVPPVVGLATSVLIARHLPPASATSIALLWWVFLCAVSTAAIIAADRVVRRLLPLSVLFGLSLAFPDEAPSRYRTALRSGTVSQLAARLDHVRRHGLGSDPGEAARTVVELLGALSVHDRLTRGHAERVRAYARLIGEEVGLRGDDLNRLQWAALVHDIGKLFVPAEILSKPGRLTIAEYEIIQEHPEAGARLVAPLAPWLGGWERGVLEHHEKLDGTGYPQGLVGSEISLAARIIAVADVFDVLTSVRSYKAAMSPAAAKEELIRCAGTHFDPVVVKAFLGVSVTRLRPVIGPLTWLLQVPLIARTPVPHLVATGGSVATGAASGAASLPAAVGTAAAITVGGVVSGTVPTTLPPAPEPVVEPFDAVVEAPEAASHTAGAGGSADGGPGTGRAGEGSGPGTNGTAPETARGSADDGGSPVAGSPSSTAPSSTPTSPPSSAPSPPSSSPPSSAPSSPPTTQASQPSGGQQPGGNAPVEDQQAQAGPEGEQQQTQAAGGDEQGESGTRGRSGSSNR